MSKAGALAHVPGREPGLPLALIAPLGRSMGGTCWGARHHGYLITYEFRAGLINIVLHLS
jgi:hypothetical protein